MPVNMPNGTNGKKAPLTVEERLRDLHEMAQNQEFSRSMLLRKMLDPRRSIEDECGYPRGWVDAATYQTLYETDPIARRVVELMPKECWQQPPTVYEDDDPRTITEFEDAWDNLGRSLLGFKSYYRDEMGSPVWEYLRRLDILSGIGQYGVLLFGIDDGLDLRTPAFDTEMPDSVGPIASGPGGSTSGFQPFSPGTAGTDAEYFRQYTGFGPTSSSKSKPARLKKGERRKLLYLRVFPELLAQITQYENNPANPRFGQPVMYLITFNDPREQHAGVGLSTVSVNVHWTRVLHVADNLMSSEVFGTPRMRPPLNRIMDIQKVYGAAAEGYWKTAFTSLSFETNPQLGSDVSVDTSGIRDQYEQWANSLQRAFVTNGMTVKTLAPSVVDPSSQIDKLIECIAIDQNCPVRVFKGSERGELASSQDDSDWNGRINGRNLTHTTPRIVIPFVDRCIALQLLPEPKKSSKKPTANRSYKRNRVTFINVYNADTGKVESKPKVTTSTVTDTAGGWSLEWPDLDSQTDDQKAGIAVKKTQALVSYVQGGCESIVTPEDFLTRFLSFDDIEAENILKAADKDNEDAISPSLLKAAGGMMGLTKLFDELAAGNVTEESMKQIIMLFYDIDEARATEIMADAGQAADEKQKQAQAQQKAQLDAMKQGAAAAGPPQPFGQQVTNPPPPGAPPGTNPGKPVPAGTPTGTGTVTGSPGAPATSGRPNPPSTSVRPAKPTKPAKPRKAKSPPTIHALTENDWVTLESGQHVYLSGGEIHPSGPPRESGYAPTSKVKASTPTGTRAAPVKARELNSMAADYSKIADPALRSRVQSAVHDYTDGNKFRDINNSLREGRSGPSAVIKDLRTAFDHVGHTLTRDVEVYRGVRDLPFALDKVGTVFTDKGFTSTTASQDMVRGISIGHARTEFRIKVPAGTRVVVPYGTSELSQEMILRDGTKFKVTKIENPRGNTRRIHLEVQP